MSNRFVGVERSSGKTAEASATVAGSPAASASARFDGLRDVHSDRVTRTLKLTDAGAIDGNEPENSWLFPGFQYWLVVLCRDAMVGVRLLPWFEATWTQSAECPGCAGQRGVPVPAPRNELHRLSSGSASGAICAGW